MAAKNKTTRLALAQAIVDQWSDIDEAYRHAEKTTQGMALLHVTSARRRAAQLYLLARTVVDQYQTKGNNHA